MEGPRVRQEPGVALGQAAVSRRMLWKLPLNVPVTAPPSLQHPTDGGWHREHPPGLPRGWAEVGSLAHYIYSFIYLFFPGFANFGM